MNGDTDLDLGPVTCGNCIPSGTPVNIRADVFGEELIGSVGFTLERPSGSGVPSSRVENVVPFAMFGDNNGNYAGFELPSGSYKITATAYSGPSQTGQSGGDLEVDFTVSYDLRRSLRRRWF